jgi:hypothetical protein
VDARNAAEGSWILQRDLKKSEDTQEDVWMETVFTQGVHSTSLYLKTLSVTARGKAQAAEGQGTPQSTP